MNIVIFAGGTGSIALQKSLQKYYGNNINVDIIISAYDNGKSTGDCRRIFHNDILGPSDLRKNQTTQFSLVKDLNSNENKAIYIFLNHRFSVVDCFAAYEYCKNYVENMRRNGLSNNKYAFLMEAIEHFFIENGNFREILKRINFQDFSISNIIYSSIANKNNNSLQKAGDIIAEYFLEMRNNIHLISDVNLFLYAYTENGNVIDDEEKIVCWSNENDKISSIKLLDKNGNETMPEVSERCTKIIKGADILILSSGTQWSSLIPTYFHKNFNSLVESLTCKKIMIMNNVEDKDMIGVTADKLIETVSRYLDLSDFDIIFNKNASKSMQLNTDCAKYCRRCYEFNLSNSGSKTHDENVLSKAIFYVYYDKFLKKCLFIFDFDDTICSRNDCKNDIDCSIENINLLNKIKAYKVISGNSSKRFFNFFDKNNVMLNNFCCDGGNHAFVLHNGLYNDFSLSDMFILDDCEDLIEIVKSVTDGLKDISIENRNNDIISIKPIKDRESYVKLIEKELLDKNLLHKYNVFQNGKTTIDIMKKNYNKKKVIELLQIDAKNSLFIGDEVSNGNDSSVRLIDGLDFLEVKNVYDTNNFLKTLFYFKNESIDDNCGW